MLWAPCCSRETPDKSGLRSSEKRPPSASATSCARSMSWQIRARVAGPARGPAAIGMIPTIAPYLLPTVIGNLTRRHPELDIHVREAMTPKLIQELAEGRLDTAIVALPVSEPSLTEVALFAEKFLLVRPGADEGNRCPARNAAPDAAASAGRGALLSRSGAVVLRHAIVAAAGGAGRELPVDARPDGRRRHRRHLDPGNGRRGGDTLGVGVCRSLQGPATLANHRHGLAQDKSSGQTAPADFRSGLPLGRRVARAAHAAGSSSRNPRT